MKILITIITCLFVLTVQGQKFKAHGVFSTIRNVNPITDTTSISITSSIINVGDKSYKVKVKSAEKGTTTYISENGFILYYKYFGDRKGLIITNPLMDCEKEVYIENAQLTTTQKKLKQLYDNPKRTGN